MTPETTQPGQNTQEIKAQIEAKIKGLDQQKQDDYQRIMVAGMKLLYSPLTHQYELAGMAKIKGPQDVPALVAQGVARIMSVVHRESGHQMSIPMSFAAGTVLACYLLEDIAKGKQIEMTDDLVAQSIAAAVKGLYTLYGIPPGKVNQVVQQGHQLMQQQSQQPGAAPVPPATPPAQGAA